MGSGAPLAGNSCELLRAINVPRHQRVLHHLRLAGLGQRAPQRIDLLHTDFSCFYGKNEV